MNIEIYTGQIPCFLFDTDTARCYVRIRDSKNESINNGEQMMRKLHWLFVVIAVLLSTASQASLKTTVERSNEYTNLKYDHDAVILFLRTTYNGIEKLVSPSPMIGVRAEESSLQANFYSQMVLKTGETREELIGSASYVALTQDNSVIWAREIVSRIESFYVFGKQMHGNGELADPGIFLNEQEKFSSINYKISMFMLAYYMEHKEEIRSALYYDKGFPAIGLRFLLHNGKETAYLFFVFNKNGAQNEYFIESITVDELEKLSDMGMNVICERFFRKTQAKLKELLL